MGPLVLSLLISLGPSSIFFFISIGPSFKSSNKHGPLFTNLLISIVHRLINMDLGASASPDIEITEGICIVFLPLLSADVNEDGGDHGDVRDVYVDDDGGDGDGDGDDHDGGGDGDDGDDGASRTTFLIATRIGATRVLFSFGETCCPRNIVFTVQL